MDLVSGFPKNLAYTLKQLSNFTKQTVKVLPDRVNAVNLGDVSRFKLPPSAMIDFRTISIFADVTLYKGTIGGGDSDEYALHLPRNTASLIQQITITCNGVQLCNINDYNLLYNTLYDLEGADYSQTSKRILENSDPSIYYYPKDTTAANSPIGVVTAMDGRTTANSYEAKRPIVINNFLGFIGSLSTPVLDLNDTGDIYIEIRWASPSVCWGTTNTSAPTYNTTTNCYLDNLRMTCSKINFESGEYYDLKAQKLLSDGLLVGYYDYWTSRGTAVQKSAGINMNFNVSTNSLDQCIATFQKSDYQTIKALVVNNGGSTTMADLKSFNQILADPVTNTTTAAGIGDAFNQSYYFMRAGCDLATSQWSINSTNVDPYPLPPSEIWNQNLIALGNNNIDFGTSGVHPGCFSLYHFLKYYFCHILSLENLSGDGLMWRSGLSGNASTVNINYAATFSKIGATDNAETIQPIIFCRSTKILTVRDGRIISVV
jgi:hypothetical protein